VYRTPDVADPGGAVACIDSRAMRVPVSRAPQITPLPGTQHWRDSVIYKPPETTPEEVEQNRERYIERVAVYRNHGHDREKAIEFVIDAAGPITPPVLDIGTGKGFAAIEIARRGVPVTSVDLSPEELRFAYLNAKAAGVDSLIGFHVMDANRLPFEDGRFNLVTMVNVLHHLDGYRDILGEISRVLVPDGTFLVADFTAEGFAILERVHESEGRVHDRKKRFGIEEIAQALPEFGLECRGRDTRFQECVMLARKV
jgi:SAM-dependent methyltransferase